MDYSKEWPRRPIKRSWDYANEGGELTSGGINVSSNTCSFDGEPQMMHRMDPGPTRSITAQSAGTKIGNVQYSPSTQVRFEIDENKKTVIKLYYDTTEALRAKGVPVDCYVDSPNPFPGENWCPEV